MTPSIVNSQSSIVNTLIQLDPGATIPTRAHETDVGYDVKALTTTIKDAEGRTLTITEICTIPPHIAPIRKVIIDTGIHITPPPGYYFELVPNSRIAKTSYIYANSFGVIDPTYTGSLKVILNAMPGQTIADLAYFLPGNVVGQLILRPHLTTTFTQVDHLTPTDRADGGFGSTATPQS